MLLFGQLLTSGVALAFALEVFKLRKSTVKDQARHLCALRHTPKATFNFAPYRYGKVARTLRIVMGVHLHWS